MTQEAKPRSHGRLALQLSVKPRDLMEDIAVKNAWTAKVVDVKATDKVDWQTIAQRFNPSYQLIAAHTTQTKATKRIGFELIK